MLIPRPPASESQLPRNLRHERRLWQNQEQHLPSLGCHGCPEHSLCGGLAIKRHVFSCLDFCCGKPDRCDVVCRQHPDFAFRVREISGFELNTIPRAALISAPILPVVIPMVFHRTSREELFAPPVAALSLYQIVHRRSGQLRFETQEAMHKNFGLAPNTKIVLSGTEKDPPIEDWWSLGARRREVIRQLRTLNIALVTTPNYSLFTDQPRWDDLHAMKRIGLVHEEFLSEGLPTALHINARAETDFQRWIEYIGNRPEVTHIAYEFATGAGWAGRREFHANWLSVLAQEVGRPIHLIVRGGLDILPILARAFKQISIVETSIFMKTMKRRRAIISNTGALAWEPAPTLVGTPLDMLLADNYRIIENYLRIIAESVSIGKQAISG